MECPICYEEKELIKFANRYCNHQYCESCLNKINRCAMCKEYTDKYIDECLRDVAKMALDLQNDDMVALLGNDFKIESYLRVKDDYCEYDIEYIKDKDVANIKTRIYFDDFVFETITSYTIDFSIDNFAERVKNIKSLV